MFAVLPRYDVDEHLSLEAMTEETDEAAQAMYCDAATMQHLRQQRLVALFQPVAKFVTRWQSIVLQNLNQQRAIGATRERHIGPGILDAGTRHVPDRNLATLLRSNLSIVRRVNESR